MTGVVEQYFYDNDGVEAEEIAEYFTEMMDAELNTQIEDGSDVLVGQDLCRIYRLCRQGNEQQVQQELNSRPKVTQANRRIVSDEDESSVPELVNDQMSSLEIATDNNQAESSNSNNIENSNSNQLEDDDGWIPVKRKK